MPADWEIPGAGSCPRTPNEDFAEGLLVAYAASVSDLLSAGLDLPGQVFPAHGRSEGEQSGVVDGVYDPGLGGSLDELSQALSKATPAAAEIQFVVVAEAEADGPSRAGQSRRMASPTFP